VSTSFELGGFMAIWKPVKNLIRQSCRTLGYEIVPLRDVKDRDFSIHLSQLFALLQIDCVFDVGANVGQYRDFLRNKVRYTGPIVSFEPIASDVSLLRKRAAQDSNWLIEGYALGAERGRMPINVAKSDQFSSFLTPDNSRTPAFAGLNETSHSEIVEIFPLDDIFAALQQRIGFRQPYLKLDTQGYDTEVLRGAKTVLPSRSVCHCHLSQHARLQKDDRAAERLRFRAHWPLSGQSRRMPARHRARLCDAQSAGGTGPAADVRLNRAASRRSFALFHFSYCVGPLSRRQSDTMSSRATNVSTGSAVS
jgi:FkbM family methyltransferase